MVKYNRKILAIGVTIYFSNKKIYISSKSSEIKNSLDITLNDLYSDEVSGNVTWWPLDVVESSYSLSLIFIGLIDYKSILSDYSFREIDSKLTSIEKKAVETLRKEIKEFNPSYISPILGQQFLIKDLYNLYKVLVDDKKDRANFYKLVRKNNFIVPVGRRKRGVYHRPPEYYRIRS